MKRFVLTLSLFLGSAWALPQNLVEPQRQVIESVALNGEVPYDVLEREKGVGTDLNLQNND